MVGNGLVVCDLEGFQQEILIRSTKFELSKNV